MPVDAWRGRGSYGPRPTYRRSTSLYPEQDYYKQPRSERRSFCFHHQQQSAQMNEDMSRRLRLGREQKRLADKLRICGKDTEHCPDFLRKQPLSGDVVLSIEIPNTDYPYIISLLDPLEKCDDSVALIMRETGVRVQFPDAPLSGECANATLTNQVKLIGPLTQVEEARRRIRKLSPVTVAFPLCSAHSQGLSDRVKNSVENAVNEKRLSFPHLKISVEYRPAYVSQFFREMFQNENVPVCMIRGPMCDEKIIFDACDEIYNYLSQTEEEEIKRSFCVSWMDIPMSQQLAVTGFPNGYLMRVISYKSNAAIFFPTPADHRVGATMFYFTGSTKSILLARRYIQGLLPVSLSFEADRSDLCQPPTQPNFCQRDGKLDVKVIIGASALESERLFDDDPVRNHVVIESTEHNLVNVYKMRQKLLKTGKKDNLDRLADDYGFIDDDFRKLVTENNKSIAEGSCSVEALLTMDGATRVPVFDPKVPAPFCSSQSQRQIDGWRETLRPQQAWVVGGIQPAPTFGAPVYYPHAAPQYCPPIRHAASLPSFNWPPYHSPSTTVMSDDRSLADIKTEHSQCSSDAPTNTVKLFLDSFKGRDAKSTSSFKRHNPMN